MRLVPFPPPGPSPDEPTAMEVEAALHGDAVGPSAEYWRELRADVRALAPELEPELERRLRARIDERVAERRSQPARGSRRSLRSALDAWLAGGVRNRAIALGAVASLLAVVAVLAIAAPWRSAGHPAAEPPSAQNTLESASGASSNSSVEHGAAAAPRAAAGAAGAAVAPGKSQFSPQAGAEDLGPSERRIQQHAVSITLAPRPQAVQSVADQVTRLATRDGGFVLRSQVDVEPKGQSSATLQLQLPSEQLSAALASLAQLAPVRVESQSLQDITGGYDAARTKLADAVAARQALLRALAHATTQGQIESLRERLSLAGGAIARAHGEFDAISKRGSSAAIEVTVSGDAHAGGGESVLESGLNDAGEVLAVALKALLIALAALAPLTILATLLVLGWRAARRRLRERALS
ncbi:MAG TPA: DUF4349 domain-containing protein [Solirubrobacteraceae bacterium]|jgi:hypothetical protein|nr:DUF4349 domain-containing protein [Solirubrobacteraceae bacterium]